MNSRTDIVYAEMRVALPNRAGQLNAAHAAGHHDVAEDEVGRRDIGKHFEGMVRVGRQQSLAISDDAGSRPRLPKTLLASFTDR